MKYILSLSFGKDSMAMLIEVLRRKLPLDYVIFCDIKFDADTSGEHPLMAEWIPQAEQILKDKFNVEVIHLTAKKNFTEQFYTVKQRGGHKGDTYGFPYIVGAWCNARLKLEPIAKFIKDVLKTTDCVTEYVGIAADEPQRLVRYKELETDTHKFITLADFNITEQQAFEICEAHNLLSPKYTYSFRGGCWFCPKQCMADLYELWKNYPEKYAILERMEEDSFNTFKVNCTLKEARTSFEKGHVPVRRKRRR